MKTTRLLPLAAAVEAVTGLALILVPSLVARLLLGAEISGVSVALARVAGIGLFSLGLACWPVNEATRPALFAILTYNLLVMLYLFYLGIRGESVGLLLWPTVVWHGAVTFFLVRAWLKARKAAVC